MTKTVGRWDTADMCGSNAGRGFNMTTASGLPFWPGDPRPEDVRIEDIAAHLSRICRFNGAIRDDIMIYSVAQHCVLVSYHVPSELALEGLLHDAAEAYVHDRVKPLKETIKWWTKRDLGEVYDPHKEIEEGIDRCIRAKFGLPLEETPEVKKADFFAAVTEKRDILPSNIEVDWGDNVPDPWPEKIVAWTPRRARDMFLQRFRDLYHEPA